MLLVPPYTAPDNQINLRYVVAMDKVAAREATVAIGWAGAIPYFSNRKCFDIYGKCDPYIAHLPAHEEVTRAGHNKFDHAYTIATYKPDIILHGMSREIPAFEQNYRPIAVRVDDSDVVLCVLKNSRWIHGGRNVSWMEAYLFLKRCWPGNS